jgi:hypothetical protein
MQRRYTYLGPLCRSLRALFAGIHIYLRPHIVEYCIIIAGRCYLHRHCHCRRRDRGRCRRRRSSCSILPALSVVIGSAVDIIMPSLATLLALSCNPRRRVPCIVGIICGPRRRVPFSKSNSVDKFIRIPISVWVFISQYLCGFRHRFISQYLCGFRHR